MNTIEYNNDNVLLKYKSQHTFPHLPRKSTEGLDDKQNN